MIRRPPRSTLFPTRRSSDLNVVVIPSPALLMRHRVVRSRWTLTGLAVVVALALAALAAPLRSEEHTSELQSRLHLVCRLLLEKKKPHPPHSSHAAARCLTAH